MYYISIADLLTPYTLRSYNKENVMVINMITKYTSLIDVLIKCLKYI